MEKLTKSLGFSVSEQWASLLGPLPDWSEIVRKAAFLLAILLTLNPCEVLPSKLTLDLQGLFKWLQRQDSNLFLDGKEHVAVEAKLWSFVPEMALWWKMVGDEGFE